MSGYSAEAAHLFQDGIDVITREPVYLWGWPKVVDTSTGNSLVQLYSVGADVLPATKGIFFLSRELAEVFFDSITGKNEPDNELSGGMLLPELFEQLLVGNKKVLRHAG